MLRFNTWVEENRERLNRLYDDAVHKNHLSDCSYFFGSRATQADDDDDSEGWP